MNLPSIWGWSIEDNHTVLSMELEKISCSDGGLHGVPLPGGQNKKSANVGALPGGGNMPLRWQIN
jgi:hypothetical protein